LFGISLFCFNAPPPSQTYTLSLHDALPISARRQPAGLPPDPRCRGGAGVLRFAQRQTCHQRRSSSGRPFVSSSLSGKLARSTRSDRKSTRLNSSHVKISYAVFCLKKKKTSR